MAKEIKFMDDDVMYILMASNGMVGAEKKEAPVIATFDLETAGEYADPSLYFDMVDFPVRSVRIVEVYLAS